MPGARLSARVAYAVRAMIDLASGAEGKPVRANEIAVRQDVPLNYLEQVLGILKRAGLVRSLRGPRGGFALARDSGSISFLDIVEAVEPEPSQDECCAGTTADQCNLLYLCAIRPVMQRASEASKRVLQQVTVADLVTMERALGGQLAPMYHI